MESGTSTVGTVDRQPKLLDRVREATRTRHYSRRTEEAYVHWIRRYIVFHGKAHPSTMAASHIAAFVGWLAVDRHVSASTQNQALSAILFLYREVLRADPGQIAHVLRAVTPVRLPVVLSVAEVRIVLDQLDGVCLLVASLLYGAGLRLRECLEVRVKDLDFDRSEITVRRGKGQKDRRTMLPERLKAPLGAHLEEVRRRHQRDLADGFGRVVLPSALERKYPQAPIEWRWQFVFPAARLCRDLRYGPPTRYHLHESAVQAVTEAGRAAGLSCGGSQSNSGLGPGWRCTTRGGGHLRRLMRHGCGRWLRPFAANVSACSYTPSPLDR